MNDPRSWQSTDDSPNHNGTGDYFDYQPLRPRYFDDDEFDEGDGDNEIDEYAEGE